MNEYGARLEAWSARSADRPTSPPVPTNHASFHTLDRPQRSVPAHDQRRQTEAARVHRTNTRCIGERVVRDAACTDIGVLHSPTGTHLRV